MNDAGKTAEGLFSQGYNCAQAVFLTFPDAIGLDERTAARLTNCLGDGLSNTGGLCGAVSAGCIVRSAKYCREEPSREGESGERQQRTYRLVQQVQKQFHEEFGDLLCPALLKRGAECGEAKNSKALCPRYVNRCAELVAALLENEDQ